MKKKKEIRAFVLVLSIGIGMSSCFGVDAIEQVEVLEEVECETTQEAIEQLNLVYEDTEFEMKQEFATKILIVEKEDKGTIEDSYGEHTRIEVGEGYFIFMFDTETDTEVAYKLLKDNPVIISVETDRVTQIASVESEMSNTEQLEIVDSFNLYKETCVTDELEEVTIALIDTEVTLIDDRILSGITVLNAEMGLSEEVKESSIYKEHGNTLTELLLSCTNSEVAILPITAINEEGNGTVMSAYLGIQAAIEAEVDIINLSFGGEGSSSILAYAIQEAKNNGITVVAAAGNGSGDVEDYMPGNIESVITVGAIDENNTITNYSNTGVGIDIVAYDTFNQGEVYSQGTSISAAYVSAALSLFIQETGERNPDDLEKILYQRAIDLGVEGKDNVYGNGELCLAEVSIEKTEEIQEETDESIIVLPTEEELEEAYNQSILAYMTTDPYSFYWSASLGNQGYGVVQEDANIYWCSRGNIASSSNTYHYDNVGWFVQIRSESGDEVVIYVDDDESVYGEEKLVDGYLYTIQQLPSMEIFEAIYESGYDYNEFCDGILTVEFDGYIKLHKTGATTYGPYDLRYSSQLSTLLSKMTSLYFSSASKIAVQEQFQDKIIYISGEEVLENNTYKLDLNGMIDGVIIESLANYGTADVYIDGKQVKNNVIDYQESHIEGTAYKINDIQLSEGVHLVGATSFAGSIMAETGIYVVMETNTFAIKYYANSGDVTSNNYYKKANNELIVSKSLGESFQVLKYGTSITPYSASTVGLSKLGYQFVGWETKDGRNYYENTSYDALDFLDSSGKTLKNSYGGEVNMYANWEANEYTIEFDANGGLGEDMGLLIVLYDEDVELTKNTYVRDGYTFIGWNTKEDGTGTAYDDGEIVRNMTDINGETIILYAMWDEAPQIEVCDIYVTSNEVELGVVTEDYLMTFAEAIDREDGILYKEANYSIGDGKETSFYIKDYKEEDFEDIANGMVTITYQAIDSVGNCTLQMANVYIVDSEMEVPESERNQLRYIEAEYSDTLAENSIWNIDQEYRDLLDMTLTNMQYKVDSAIEVESNWGYSAIDPGSGVFLDEPMKTWKLDNGQISQMQDQIINYGFSYMNS